MAGLRNVIIGAMLNAYAPSSHEIAAVAGINFVGK